MYCQNRISYRVQEGDSLYKLAKQFHTTVTELILLNSGVNPYNLQTGMRLTICPGEGYVDENESKPSEGNTNKPTKTPVGGIVIIPELRHSREAQHARNYGTAGRHNTPGNYDTAGNCNTPGNHNAAGKQHGRGSATAHAHGMAQSYYTCKILSHQFLKTCQARMRGKTPCTKMQRRFLRFCSVLSGFSNAEIPQTFYGAFASDR